LIVSTVKDVAAVTAPGKPQGVKLD